MVETRSADNDLNTSPSRVQEQHPTTWIRSRTKSQPAGRRARGGGLTTAQLYVLLALAYALLALPLMFSPKSAAHWLYGDAAVPLEDQHAHVLGLLASDLVLVTTLSFALEEASFSRAGSGKESARLRGGLAAYSVLSLLTHVLYPTTLRALPTLVVLLTHATTLVLLASQSHSRAARAVHTTPHAAEHLEGLWPAVHAALRLPHGSILGRAYLGLSLAGPLFGILLTLTPETTMFHTLGYVYGRSTLMPWRLYGVGLLTLSPVLTLTLKDKAEAGVLDRSIARTLNAGLLATSIGGLLIFGSILMQAHGGVLLAPVVAAAIISALTAVLGLTAPELEELAEAALVPQEDQ